MTHSSCAHDASLIASYAQAAIDEYYVTFKEKILLGPGIELHCCTNKNLSKIQSATAIYEQIIWVDVVANSFIHTDALPGRSLNANQLIVCILDEKALMVASCRLHVYSIRHHENSK